MSDDTALEEWRVIPGFPDYQASNLGRVRSFRSGPEPRILKPSPMQGKAYLKLSLTDADGKCYTRMVHNLVLQTFVGPTPPGLESCHNNGDGKDNRLANLRYDTHSNNLLDMRAHGTRKRKPRLTDEQVQTLRDKYATGLYTIGKLSDKSWREMRTDWHLVKRVVTTDGPIDWSQPDRARTVARSPETGR